MSEPAGEAKLEVKQASKEAKESENVAEKYSAMTVSKNTEVNMGELSPAFSAVPTHKPVKKVRVEENNSSNNNNIPSSVCGATVHNCIQRTCSNAAYVH